MKNILMLQPSSLGGCEFYRSVGVVPELHRFGDVHIKKISGQLQWSDTTDCDVAYLSRPSSKTSLGLCRFLQNKMPIWVDYDDYLFDIPVENPAFYSFMTKEVADNMTKIMEIAHVVSVSTEELGRLLVRKVGDWLGKKIHVIPNAYNDYRLPKTYSPTKSEDSKVVLWRGTFSHIGDLYNVAVELNNFIVSRPDVIFVFLGYVPWMLDINLPNVRLVAPQDTFAFFRSVDMVSPDVTIVPLTDCDFNKAKSNIAWLETAKYGGYTVAPNWDEWRHVGVVNYDNSFSFVEAIEYTLGLERTEKNWDYVKENFFLSKINKKRFNLLEKLCE